MPEIIDCPQIILSVFKPGEYFGKEAQERVNLLAQTLHSEVIRACSYHPKMNLIKTFYDFFDKACYMSIDGTSWIKDEDIMLKAVLKAPSTGRYLLETSIAYGGEKENNELTKEIVMKFLAAGQTFVSCCNISNYFFYGNYKGGLKIGEDGTIEDIISEQAQKVMDTYFEKMRIRKKAIINMSSKPKTAKNEDYFYDLAKTYDDFFYARYGIKLTLIVTLVLAMYHLRKERFGLVVLSRKDLIKMLEKEQKADYDKALKLLEITKNLLMNDWKYYKLYRVPVSVVRKPIVNLSGKIGGHGTVVYGGHAMLHSLALLFTDIEMGEVELGLDADAIQKKRGLEFEKRLVRELIDLGLNAIHVAKTTPEVGDIDALAFIPHTNTVIVIEAKSPRINIDVSRIGKQIEESKKWHVQLNKKINWVNTNIDFVKQRLKIEVDRTVSIDGMIVTEVPWFFEDGREFKMLTLEELKLLLENGSI